MPNRNLILIGAGGHCTAVLSQIILMGRFNIVGAVDNYKPIGSEVGAIKVIGRDEDLPNIYKNNAEYALITVGSTEDNSKRMLLYELANEIGFRFPSIISPQAFLDGNVDIGPGTVIMPGSIVNYHSSIGINCIINSGAIIEHDCKIGNHCHIAPGVNISGSVKIGDMAFIGIGSTIIQNLTIGSAAIIGAGSVVIRNVPDNAVVVGNPAKQIRLNYEKV